MKLEIKVIVDGMEKSLRDLSIAEVQEARRQLINAEVRRTSYETSRSPGPMVIGG